MLAITTLACCHSYLPRETLEVAEERGFVVAGQITTLALSYHSLLLAVARPLCLRARLLPGFRSRTCSHEPHMLHLVSLGILQYWQNSKQVQNCLVFSFLCGIANK